MSRYLDAWAAARGAAIKPETARWLIREAHGMLRAALAGASSRDVWPMRFSRKNPWYAALPPSGL
ncbi:MAG: hypothetical protein HY812_07240 [Planctomycetes bacterium]|nr:hypothetical protein [Planctomycetota bacterium]